MHAGVSSLRIIPAWPTIPVLCSQLENTLARKPCHSPVGEVGNTDGGRASPCRCSYDRASRTDAFTRPSLAVR